MSRGSSGGGCRTARRVSAEQARDPSSHYETKIYFILAANRTYPTASRTASCDTFENERTMLFVLCAGLISVACSASGTEWSDSHASTAWGRDIVGGAAFSGCPSHFRLWHDPLQDRDVYYECTKHNDGFWFYPPGGEKPLHGGCSYRSRCDLSTIQSGAWARGSDEKSWRFGHCDAQNNWCRSARVQTDWAVTQFWWNSAREREADGRGSRPDERERETNGRGS